MTVADNDFSAFTEFEKAAWVKLPEHYDRIVGPMTRLAVDGILSAIDLRPGARVLDVATGIGYVAAEAKRRGADTLGLDFSADMIAEAKRYYPDLAIEQGDAEALSYADASFDAVTCAFGMLHFPRPGRALAEAYRVLRPGGRFAFTVWCAAPANKFFGAIADIMMKNADMSAAPPRGPNQFMLSDPLVCLALMDAVGFTGTRTTEIACEFVMRQPGDMLEFMRRCAVRAVYIYDRQTPQVKAVIEQAIMNTEAKALAETEGRMACPILLVSGTKPKA